MNTSRIISCFLLGVVAPLATADEELVVIPRVEIQIIDRLGEPVPGVEVGVVRQVEKPKPMQQSYFRVTRKNSDSSGHVVFEDLLAGNFIGAATPDGRFQGQLQLEPDTEVAELILNQFSGISIKSRGAIDEEAYAKAQLFAETLRLIIKDFSDKQRTEFLSLQKYVTSGLIGREEAQNLIDLKPLLRGEGASLNFGWSNFQLSEPIYEEPLEWYELRSETWARGRWFPAVPRAKRTGWLKKTFENHSAGRK